MSSCRQPLEDYGEALLSLLKSSAVVHLSYNLSEGETIAAIISVCSKCSYVCLQQAKLTEIWQKTFGKYE